MSKTVLMPLPAIDFDPTEAAVPWKILTDAGIQVRFATPDGRSPQCDLRMLNGDSLGILKTFLMADKNAQAAYRLMQASDAFKTCISWNEIKSKNYDGIVLAGGHAPGMKPYLESNILQSVVTEFFAAEKSVGAICHGVVLVARSLVGSKSVLYGRRTTALLASQELTAWALTRFWLGQYYRTYPQTVEAEVRSVLKNENDFLKGPSPLFRDEINKLDRGFVVHDGNYISARWPGDAHKFAVDFLAVLNR